MLKSTITLMIETPLAARIESRKSPDVALASHLRHLIRQGMASTTLPTSIAVYQGERRSITIAVEQELFERIEATVPSNVSKSAWLEQIIRQQVE